MVYNRKLTFAVTPDRSGHGHLIPHAGWSRLEFAIASGVAPNFPPSPCHTTTCWFPTVKVWMMRMYVSPQHLPALVHD